MAEIYTVKVDDEQKYLSIGYPEDGAHVISILARPTPSLAPTDGAIVGREYPVYLQFNVPSSSDSTVDAEATITIQPIRDYKCLLSITASLQGGKQAGGEFSVNMGDQTLLSNRGITKSQITGEWCAGLSLCFYVGRDNRLRMYVMLTDVYTNSQGTNVAKIVGYKTEELEAGVKLVTGVEWVYPKVNPVPTELSIDPGGLDRTLNYYRRSYYEGDISQAIISEWVNPWSVSVSNTSNMSVDTTNAPTWRVPYNTAYTSS